MEEFKGTRGPWRVSEKRGDLIDIRHDNNEPGAMSLSLARVIARPTWVKEAELNASLIAAAPELLEALQLSISVIKNMAGPSQSKKAALELANAAIAKALGK